MQSFLSYKHFTQSSYQCYYSLSYGPMPYIISCPVGHLEIINMNQYVIQPIIKEVYGLTVLYRHVYAVKGTILSHFSRPKVTLKLLPRSTNWMLVLHHVLNLQSHFQCNIVSIKCENISKKAKNGLGKVLWWSVDDLQ